MAIEQFEKSVEFEKKIVKKSYKIRYFIHKDLKINLKSFIFSKIILKGILQVKFFLIDKRSSF